MPTSRRKKSIPAIKWLLWALAFTAAVAGGYFCGAWYESRQERQCTCNCGFLLKQLPTT
jgi:hypothetical protein